jgi:hypothetical protein
MPLTEKGSKIKSAMEEQYGPEKGESVFYASKNAGTITGVDAMDAARPFGMEDPVTKGESIADQESMLHPPSLLPDPDLEHPQQHPGESAPPEDCAADAARPFGMEDPVTKGGAASGDQITEMPSTPAPVTADQHGGIVGGAIPQSWGTPWKGPTGDALPSECSLAEIQRDNARFWEQWAPRPLGPDQK